jgi:outer membrane protein assembly factor BamB
MPISQREAQLNGLQRAWITQVALDRSRDRLSQVHLDGPQLFIQTDKSLLQAIDAETGGKMWTAQVGNREYPTSNAAANEKYVAVINGTTLYVLDRFTGRTIHEHRSKHVPGQHVAMNNDWVYIPALNGQMEVFGLQPPHRKWTCGSQGRIDMPPLVARRTLVWGTSSGYVYFTAVNEGSVNFRLQTNAAVAAPMGYWPPIILAASRDGYLYAIHEGSGETLWRYSLGEAVNTAPIAIGGAVYVVPSIGGMHCLSCEDGAVRWFAPKASRLLAVTPSFVYAADRLGNLLLLDAKSGGHLQTIEAWQFPVKYTNVQNDRLYLGTELGMLMCLRELPLKEPIVHLLPDEAGKPKATKPDETVPESVPSEAVNPFGAPAKP